MHKDGILVAEQFVTSLPKWSHDLQLMTLSFSELKELNQMNQLVVSSHSAYILVLTVFLKFIPLVANTETFFILKMLEGSVWGSIGQRQQYLNYITVCKQMIILK